MKSIAEIEIFLKKTESFIEKEKYKGFDPYDGLCSPIFKTPFLNSNKKIRFLSQQFLKRLPFNIRNILLIKKGYNPVTIGLCIQGYVNLAQAYPEKKDYYINKIEFLVNELTKLIPDGYSGNCWGYDFDWEARYSKIPAFQPTIVATGIITNALFKYWLISKEKHIEQMIVSACNFVLNDINKSKDNDGDICFSYSPFDHQIVFNASMKGVRLLSQAYLITKNNQFKIEAKKACSFIIKHQHEDGSWIYSRSKSGEWIDNYHTGYILDCLNDYINYTFDKSYIHNLEKGYKFYRTNFFQNETIPKFYNKSVYPIDCTAAGQSLLTLINFNDIKTAQVVCSWMIENMQGSNGSFYYRKYKNYTNKTSFMRWSNAWMFLGMSELIKKTKSN